jgi:hypothetical protein
MGKQTLMEQHITENLLTQLNRSLRFKGVSMKKITIICLLCVISVTSSVIVSSQGKTLIDAWLILDRINKGEDILYENIIVDGDLDLTTINDCIINSRGEKRCYINSHIEFRHSLFYGELIAGYQDGDGKTVKVMFQRDAIFIDNKMSFYTTFTYAHFTGESLFYDNQFKEGADFSYCKFNCDADFFNTQFTGEVSFFRSRIIGDAIFNQTIFNADANLSEILLNGEADFSFSQFDGEAYFHDSRFDDYAYLTEIQFNDKVNFKYTQFNRWSSFAYSRFDAGVSYLEGLFVGDADFTYTEFTGSAEFDETNFMSDVDFTGSMLNGEDFDPIE